jgi:hypothetical protein
MPSRGEFAWVVVSEPSWPVFIAWSMSRHSPPRVSPTMIRSGRMRRAFRTRSRMVYSPLPSMLGGRDSSETTWGWLSCSSAASSMVTMRSSLGIALESTLSRVVLPEPVPPEMTMFFLAMTARVRKRAICSVMAPNSMMFCSVSGVFENLRMVMHAPLSASGRITAFTREPSFRRASTSGVLSSMRRPRGVTMRSMHDRTASSSVKRASTRLSLPLRST